MHARIANSTSRILRRSLSRFPSSSPWVCASCQSRSTRNRFASTAAIPNEKPYYVTTPIFYVNAAPHVGHLYTMVLADVEKRWHVMKGQEAILLTGTDEHGLKVQRAAAKAGIEPKLFCDRGARIFKVLPKSRLYKLSLTYGRTLQRRPRSTTIILCERPTKTTKMLSSTLGYAYEDMMVITI